MARYEALYGRKCRTPVFWIKLRQNKLVGSDLIREIEEKVKGESILKHVSMKKCSSIWKERKIEFEF
ncbi:taxadiene 5-alpha hydroxylase [Gossypium australe]|uniref:Taxadiene 5-alpha hydroxylase n=1 Tax=Gossypium australe TaxID=47621 RepID=A0A5B6VXQ1_9ROSI|nr:taxadiene 5-alpha hydroxylase [Gossypium australe]